MRPPLPFATAALLLMLTPLPEAGAEELTTLEEVNACIEANLPKTTSIQTVEFVSTDNVGYEKTTRAKTYSKQGDDSMRRVLTLFTRPIDVRGAQYLMIEKPEGPSDMFVYTPELRKTKRITGRAASGSLFGTDFSYEDFERLHHLNKPGESRLQENQVVMDRAAYVIETRPSANAGSAYETIVSFWDQKTCVALKTESFERGQRLRKVLTSDPDQIHQVGGLWFAHSMLMRDERDNTRTQLLIENIEVGVPIKDRTFLVSQLGKNLR